jgi:lipid A ethanolaminephosphotransferase
VNRRRSSSAIKFVYVTSLANAALYHVPLFAFALANLDSRSFHGVLTLSTLFAAIFAATAAALLLLLMLGPRLVKAVCMLIALGNSIAVYFVVTYQAVLDKAMMGNVSNTSLEEAAAFLHPKMLLYFLAFGVLPCVLLSRVSIDEVSKPRAARYAAATLVAGLGWMYLASGTWLWIDKNGKKLGGMVMPWSYVMNMARYQTMHLTRSHEQTLLPPATIATNGRTVVILVIGESARAQDFSLYGYRRLTNPSLTAAGAVALKNSTSCSTYTTASLRCILSHTDSSSEFSKQYEPLPSYLQRFGVDVIWRTNNWGEPPLKVQSYERARDLRQDCTDGCEHDEALLIGLLDRIRSSAHQDVFVVLHQRGSHGPAYYAEYPTRFETFKPVCESVELDQCTGEQLTNAYDNTILYTDYFLGAVIHLLENLPNASTMMMYVSDHGESLGEYGLYLHGTPFSIAPIVQKQVPFIVWMSSAFMDREAVSPADLARRDSHSQSDVFHSVLGAFDMCSDAYDPRFDIFHANASHRPPCPETSQP